ncbi:hypothetical protein KQH49_01895 [Mycetohabitans sp. B5]|uniref:hypothetical protein n=1 Tax=Mycetohabitans TaxID=2571159 RepID=UPI001F4478DA|nr:hypothetical protein [Mycetohabitans sp. B5]MCG1053781.1 hypothetical protein [Mycetohabitans sp. B5]
MATSADARARCGGILVNNAVPVDLVDARFGEWAKTLCRQAARGQGPALGQRQGQVA